MSERPGVSIVIPNYNYQRFVGEAIDSALTQTYEPVEVIVVDDGSTDGSRAVIERYADRVQAVFQANGGQLSACAAGFARARHDIVVFLDSDDVLLPDAAATIVRHWRPGLAKLQFPFDTIDGDGNRQGYVWPKYPPRATDPANTGAAKDELLRTGGYPTPPTSGNAFARHTLEAAMPFAGHLFVDSLINTIAPLYGDILTIERPLALYRVHGANNWSQQALTPERFEYYARSERMRMPILADHCAKLNIAFEGPQVIERSLYLREVELVRAKLEGGWIGLGLAITRQGVRAAWTALREPGGGRQKLLRAGWAVAVSLAPQPLAQRLIAMRFVQAARPKRLERLIAWFGKRPDRAARLAAEVSAR